MIYREDLTNDISFLELRKKIPQASLFVYIFPFTYRYIPIYLIMEIWPKSLIMLFLGFAARRNFVSDSKRTDRSVAMDPAVAVSRGYGDRAARSTRWESAGSN